MLLGSERMGVWRSRFCRRIYSHGKLYRSCCYLLQFTLLDNTQYDAEIVAQDFASGAAVLKVVANGLPSVPLRPSGDLKPGDDVFLVASSGEDSGRRVNGGAIMSVAPFDAYWEYATDRALVCTAMNPGPGGGPMFDMNGRMVGIAYLQPQRGRSFPSAIPVENFIQHKDELLRYGRRVSATFTGMDWNVFFTLREHLVIAGVLPGGPGDKAGLKAGDVVNVAIDSEEVSDRRKFYDYLWGKRAGETVLFRVFRNNSVRDIAVISGSVEQFFG